MWGEPGRDRDEKSWLLCTNRQGHEQEKLMLTQIIAGDSLAVLGRRVHETRAAHAIPMYCGCAQSTTKPTNGVCKVIVLELQSYKMVQTYLLAINIVYEEHTLRESFCQEK